MNLTKPAIECWLEEHLGVGDRGEWECQGKLEIGRVRELKGGRSFGQPLGPGVAGEVR